MLNTEETEEILSTLTLTRLQGLSQSQALALVNFYGSATEALADAHPKEAHWASIMQNAAALRQARDRAQEEYDFCQRHGIRVLTVTSPDYPRLLLSDEVTDRPLQLFYRGTANLNCRHSLSIVGTRQITEYGKQMCENLLRDLATLIPDLLVVSGLAYGVDIHAHRAALAHDLNTVAVLAHGLDRIYPRLHRDTAKEMTHHGGLLTEYFSQTNPDKGNFVRRNRIVAGMTSATLIVESASHGGSLITATLASGYGREVMAVPGRATDECSAGCNQFIRENRASLVTSAADIINVLGWKVANPARPAQPTLFPIFSPEQERILSVMHTADELTLDQLSSATSYSISQLTDLLFDLEDAAAVKRMPGNRYRLCK